MKIKTFREEYNPKTKHTVLYTGAYGLEQGTVLDSPVLKGTRYVVAVDSYQNMVPVRNISSIKDTMEKW